MNEVCELFRWIDRSSIHLNKRQWAGKDRTLKVILCGQGFSPNFNTGVGLNGPEEDILC
jgi:hypothetical protein